MHEIEGTSVEIDTSGKLKIGFRVGGTTSYVERLSPDLASELILQLDEAANEAHRQRVVATLA